jgi:hypothetical protein
MIQECEIGRRIMGYCDVIPVWRKRSSVTMGCEGIRRG